MSLPPSKRRVMARMDLPEHHADTSPSSSARSIHPSNFTRGPGSSAPGFMSSTTPLRRPAGASAASASTGRAKVDMSAISISSTPPVLRRNPATTPCATSPFMRDRPLVSSAITSSAPSTPSHSNFPVRSASPNNATKSSPFDRGYIPANVTVRRGAGFRAKARNLSSDGKTTTAQQPSFPFPSPASPSLASQSLELSSPTSNGRLSPVRGQTRSATAQRTPTAASLHAAPSQARLGNAFSPTSSAPPRAARGALPDSSPDLQAHSPTRSPSPTHLQSRLASSFLVSAKLSVSPSRVGPGNSGAPTAAMVVDRKSKATSVPDESKRVMIERRPVTASEHRGSEEQYRRRSSSSSTTVRDLISQIRKVGPVTTGHAAGTIVPASQSSYGSARLLLPSILPSSVDGDRLAPLPSSSAAQTPAIEGFSPAHMTYDRNDFSTAFERTADQRTAPMHVALPKSETSSFAAAQASSGIVSLEYAQLRVERKIADLEITNKSLMAINSGLELTKHRQQREIRELRRRVRYDQGLSFGSEDIEASRRLDRRPSSETEKSDLNDDFHDDDEDLSSELGLLPPREDPELEAAHQRCKGLIDAMLGQARATIMSRYAPESDPDGGVKVLSMGEVHEIQEAERLEVEEDETGVLAASLQAPVVVAGSPDVSADINVPADFQDNSLADSLLSGSPKELSRQVVLGDAGGVPVTDDGGDASCNADAVLNISINTSKASLSPSTSAADVGSVSID